MASSVGTKMEEKISKMFGKIQTKASSTVSKHEDVDESAVPPRTPDPVSDKEERDDGVPDYDYEPDVPTGQADPLGLETNDGEQDEDVLSQRLWVLFWEMLSSCLKWQNRQRLDHCFLRRQNWGMSLKRWGWNLRNPWTRVKLRCWQSFWKVFQVVLKMRMNQWVRSYLLSALRKLRFCG